MDVEKKVVQREPSLLQIGNLSHFYLCNTGFLVECYCGRPWFFFIYNDQVPDETGSRP